MTRYLFFALIFTGMSGGSLVMAAIVNCWIAWCVLAGISYFLVTVSIALLHIWKKYPDA